MTRGRKTASVSMRKEWRPVMRCTLSLLTSVIILVTALNPAFACLSKQSNFKDVYQGKQITGDCNSDNKNGYPPSSGQHKEHACCILNSSRDHDDIISCIAILPILILTVLIDESALSEPISDINAKTDDKVVIKSHFAQPPPAN